MNWKRPTEDYDSVTGHQILRAVGDGEMTVLVDDNGRRGTAYLDSDVEAGQTYAYRVIALRGEVKSPPSNRVEVEFPYAPEELAPSGLAAAVADAGVALSWQAPARKADAVTGYRVLRAEGEQESIILAPDTASQATTYTDATAAMPGATYVYWVVALRGEEESEPSSPASVTLTNPAPTGLTLEVADDGIVLRWKAPTGDAGSVTGYRVQRSTSHEPPAILVDDTGNRRTAYTDTSATVEGATYFYAVMAVRGEETGPASNLAVVKRPPEVTPLPPTDLVAEVVPEGVTLVWREPANASPTGYSVMRGQSELTVLVKDTGNTDTTYTDTTANVPGSTYTYEVAALYDKKESPPSNLAAVNRLSFSLSKFALATSECAPRSVLLERDSLEEAHFNTLAAAGNEAPTAIWSDGQYMWVADSSDDKLYAYRMSNMARAPSRDFNTLIAAGNDRPTGIWSDGETMWVADSRDNKIYAYNMKTKARDGDKDFDTLQAAGNGDPQGVWSDCETMWVSDQRDSKVYAYQMSDRARQPGQDFNTLDAAGNSEPTAIWSDTRTMWAADYDLGKLFAYSMDSKGRDNAKEAEITLKPGNRDVSGMWSDGATLWVADFDDAKIYAFDLPGRILLELDVGGSDGASYPWGIWSDGETMWVSDPRASGDTRDAKIFAYSLADMSRMEDEDFDTLAAAGNDAPRGIWSNGATMWVADSADDKIYAYNLETKARLPGRDFNTLDAAGNEAPLGLWSDGVIIWVADPVANRIFAYRLADPPPTVSRVTIEGTTTTGATAKVYIKDADGSTVTVHLRYRQTGGGGAWTRANGKDAILGPASFTLRGLTPHAEYEVQASHRSSFPAGATVSTTLVTVDVPRLAGVEVESVRIPEVSIAATVTNADGSTVYLRYREAGSRRWVTKSESVDDDGLSSVSFSLKGLDTGTEYEAQASLDSGFPFGAATRTFTFSTPPIVWDAILTVVHDADDNSYGFSPGFAGSSLVPDTFTMDGVDYTFEAFFDNAENSEVVARIRPELPAGVSMEVLVEGRQFLSSRDAMTRLAGDGVAVNYVWINPYTVRLGGDSPVLGWSDGDMLGIRMLTTVNTCERTPVVQEAILAATLTTDDTCDFISLLDLEKVTELDFTGRYVPKLRNGDFKNLPNLERLDLSGQPLFYRLFQAGDEYGVAHKVFAPLSNLRELDLSDTDLWSLPTGMFDDLTSLETLHIRNSGYPAFPDGHPHVQGNKPDQKFGVRPLFGRDLFKDLGNLRELDVRPATPLTAAPWAFEPLTSLETYNGEPYTQPPPGPTNLTYSAVPIPSVIKDVRVFVSNLEGEDVVIPHSFSNPALVSASHRRSQPA